MGVVFWVPPPPEFFAIFAIPMTAFSLLLLLLMIKREYGEDLGIRLFRVLLPPRFHKLYKRIGGLVLIGLLVFFTFILVTGSLAKVELHEDRLDVVVLPFASVTLKKEDIIKAFVTDLGVGSSMAPVMRVAGAALDSYRAGWFKLANGADALILSVRRTNLYIETTLGYYIVLGPYQFEEFLEAFKAFHPVERSAMEA